MGPIFWIHNKHPIGPSQVLLEDIGGIITAVEWTTSVDLQCELWYICLGSYFLWRWSMLYQERPDLNYTFFNALAPRLWFIIFKLITQSSSWGTCCETALKGMPQNFTNVKSTLIQVMAWCWRSTSNYWANVDTNMCCRIPPVSHNVLIVDLLLYNNACLLSLFPHIKCHLCSPRAPWIYWYLIWLNIITVINLEHFKSRYSI